MHLPREMNVSPLTTIRRNRSLPLPGRILVDLNQRVRPADVIAEAEISPRHQFIDVAGLLGITAREVARFLGREIGERVDKGEIIAGPSGIARKVVRAPYGGAIVAITGGKVLFEVRSEPLLLRAGFPGEVISIEGNQTVTLETTGALIQGVWGNGRQDFGIMRVAGNGPRERLITDQLDMSIRGAVLVAGICDHPAPLLQAKDLSVRGIILGGLSAELIPLANKLPYPIVLLEGFGAIPINRPAFELLSTSRGREAALDARPASPFDARRPEVIIPLPVVNPVGMPEELVQLSRGVRVRVTRAPHQGVIGMVEAVLPHSATYPNGIMAKSARVDLDIFGSTNVPLANLEVLP
jgi:hypothetical protein